MPAASSITTVVFDFDGVLADTEGLHLSAFQQVFARRGWQLDAPTYFERYLGCDDVGLVVEFGRDRSLAMTATDVRAIAEEKARVFADLVATGQVLYPSAAACIDRLRNRFALGIASGALHREIEAILDGAGLLEYFPVIVAADDVQETKPSPEPYATAARLLGVAPDRCVAVEDSEPGLDSARAAGMHTIGVTTTAPAHRLRAGRVIDDLAELTPGLVDDLGRRTGRV